MKEARINQLKKQLKFFMEENDRMVQELEKYELRIEQIL
jgi:hypothetical protein